MNVFIHHETAAKKQINTTLNSLSDVGEQKKTRGTEQEVSAKQSQRMSTEPLCFRLVTLCCRKEGDREKGIEESKRWCRNNTTMACETLHNVHIVCGKCRDGHMHTHTHTDHVSRCHTYKHEILCSRAAHS
uniref:Uncharacterized protein n=1 Tax=Rhipicephalus microplus TaxID=6941 RepID=A0A6G5AIU9_RHIMP